MKLISFFPQDMGKQLLLCEARQAPIHKAPSPEDSLYLRLGSLQFTEVKPHQSLWNPVSLEHPSSGAISYWSSYCSGSIILSPNVGESFDHLSRMVVVGKFMVLTLSSQDNGNQITMGKVWSNLWVALRFWTRKEGGKFSQCFFELC